MENKNCLDCLYANYNHTALVLQEFTHEELRKCEHPNSAYFDQFVSTEICRLFLDEKEYFRNKDLREKLIKLKTKQK